MAGKLSPQFVVCGIIFAVKYFRLFWEFFKISLFVVGGGYAIIVVADEIFGKKLKWVAEGELLDHLSVFQMVPGLIAGNTAIYVGLKTAGRTGAAVALVGVALPSFLIFLALAMGYQSLNVDNRWAAGALFGLRASLTGIVFGTLLKGFRKNVSGVFGALVFAGASVFLIVCRVNVVAVLLGAMLVGLAWTLAGGRLPPPDDRGSGIALAPLNRRARLLTVCGLGVGLLGVTLVAGTIFWTFLKFGLLGFGGGFVLVPLYLQTFVGETAALLQLPAEEFSNLMALTQATPGPVSVNAATFFGYRLGGIGGAAVATMALLLPSYFLLTAALAGLDRFKRSRFVQGILWGVRPATNALIAKAAIAFAMMSVWQNGFHPYAAVLAVLAATLLLTERLSIMSTIFLCAALGAVECMM